MKTITSLKFFITIITIAVFMLIIKSCKKTDSNAITNKADEASRAAAIKAFKDEYGNVTAGIIINVNKAADEYFYKDANGKMVSLYSNSTTNTGTPGVGGISGPSVCKANCSTTSNPADLRIIYTLDYVQRFASCDNTDKSTVSVKWTVSVPFQIGYTNNNFPALHYGDVVFKNSSGTPINTLIATNGQVTSTMLGADPSCPTWNNLWEITYNFTQVGNGNFASGNTIEASISLENDCSLVGNVVTSNYVSAPTFSQNAYLPCNRIDFVFLTPTGPGTPTPWQALSMEGASLTCSFPSGWTYVDEHQLEYRQITNTSSDKWVDQSSPVYWGVPKNTSTPYPTVGISGDPAVLNLVNMVNVNNNWLVRYRNVKTGVCDIIIDNNPLINPGGTLGANADWGNPALWFTKKW
ncbi:hypothetical protein [Ferruginibacter sp.]|nr:hypothetical protein [Ferruginibacter sp.]